MKALKIIGFYCLTYLIILIIQVSIDYVLVFVMETGIELSANLVGVLFPYFLAALITWRFNAKGKFNKKSKEIAKRVDSIADDNGSAIRNGTPDPKPKQNKVLSGVSRNFDAITLSIGGIIVALRLFFPPQYYSYRGVTLPAGSSESLAKTDYQTALLQSLGVAVITGVLFFLIKRHKKNN